MTDFFTKARLFYGNLEPARQTQLWLAVAGVLLAVIGVSWWMSNEPYAVVHQGSQAELAEAASLLAEEGIPTRTDGVSISVPESQRGAAIGALAPAFRPAVIESGMGDPPRIIDEKTRRLKEQELARNISEMPGIHGAQVSITLGEESLFRDEPGRPATASVFLKVSPSQPPNSETARAIATLVANAVPGLDPGHVAVTDSLGTVHREGQGGGSDDMRLGNDLLKLRAKYAADARSQVSQILALTVGRTDAFVVTATAEIERESRVITSKDYNTDKIFKSTSELHEKAKEKQDAASEGAPGVDSALPERAADSGVTGGAAKQKEDETRIKEQMTAPESLEKVVIPAGELKRLAVSAVINETAAAAVWGVEPGSAEFDAQLADLQTAAKQAFGFDEARGDTFALVAKPFAPVEVTEASAVDVTGAISTVAPFVPYAIALVALLLAFMFVVRPLMAQVAKAPLPRISQEDTVIGPDGKPRRLAPGEDLDDDNLAERLHRLVENFQPVDSADLNRLVEQQSDASAKVVRDWMKQGA